MIRFIVTPGHEYTFEPLVKPPSAERRFPMQIWSYSALFGMQELPLGTWVFGDIERLANWELRLAGEIAELLIRAGARVLNHPAKAAARYELLMRLHQAGFNGFRAWRAEDGIPPARFPVFLRIESNHKLPLSELIETPEALAAAIEGLLQQGIPRRGMLIMEYQAEPDPSGTFRKYGAYRIGNRIVPDHFVQDISWVAKFGHPDCARDEYYREEIDYVRDNPHADPLMQAFEIGGIDYGRADYGIVEGRIQVWEINTNPRLPKGDLAKAKPQRLEAARIALDNRMAAFEALDARIDRKFTVDSPLLQAHRERQSKMHRDLVRE